VGRNRPGSRLARLAGELLLVVVALLALERFLTRDAARGPAPAIEASLTTGEPFSLAALGGRPVLVYFWAEWCPVCAASQGTISGVLADHPGVTIALRSGGAAAVQAYLDQHHLDWPTVADEAGAIAGRYGVSGVPAVFVLDRHGEVRFVTRGYTTALGLRARLWLAGPTPLTAPSARAPPARGTPPGWPAAR
jgi:peroxiredoxin